MKTTVNNEEILWSANRKHMGKFGTYFILSLMTLLFFPGIIALPWMACLAFKINSTRYELTSESLKIYSGVFHKKCLIIKLDRIIDTRLDKPLSNRLFNLGDLVIMTSLIDSQIVVVEAIKDSETVLIRLRELVATANRKR